MSDSILDALARPTTLCAFCPKMCRSACPVSEAEGREAVTPWGKMSLVHLARTGRQSLADKGAQKAIEACTGCGACVEKCAHGNPVAETLFSARGVAGSERIARHRGHFERTGDVKGRDHTRALEGVPKSRTARVAYFPGCARAAVDGAAAVRRDLRALARATGEDVVACEIGPSSGVQCCGYPLYADGQLDLVEENLEKLGELLAGHELVVTPDPGCAYMLSTVQSVLVGRRGKSRAFPAVVPLVEALGQNAHRFTDASKGLVVRYHDSCYLGRRGRTFDAPRKLLEAATGHPPLEFHKNHDDADCSGAGGLYPMSNPEGSRAMARRRITHDGAAHDPADVVVTACPSSRRNFQRAGLRAVDLVDVILGGSAMKGAFVFVVNPRSANGATLRRFERVRARFAQELGDIEVRLTERPRHATELARAAVEAGAKAVISVGGDGTNNEVINGFFDASGKRIAGETAFGVVTSGTGGDFRRTFGWTTEPLDDLARLKRFETRGLDIGRVTFGDGSARCWVNIASFGMSGEVVDVVNHSSKALGAKLSFMLASLRTMVGHQPQKVRVTVDDQAPWEDDVTLVAVANGQYFGGGMWIAPEAKVDDGQLDCVAVSGGGLGFWLAQGLKVYTGKHIGLREVRCSRCHRVKAEPVKPGERVLVEIDGEQPGILPATFEILPAAVRLLV